LYLVFLPIPLSGAILRPILEAQWILYSLASGWLEGNTWRMVISTLLCHGPRILEGVITCIDLNV
jgi:hypothetical protein